MIARTIARSPGVGAEILNEAAVDLEGVHRQRLQMRQHAVAGPEVVDRDPDADLLEGRQRDPGGLDVLHHDTLGDLQAHRLAGQPELARSCSATVSAKPSATSCTGDTLSRSTASCPMPRERHLLNSVHAARITQRPNSPARLIGFGDSDERIRSSSPRVGCCQRTRASVASTSPVRMSISGR